MASMSRALWLEGEGRGTGEAFKEGEDKRTGVAFRTGESSFALLTYLNLLSLPEFVLLVLRESMRSSI